MPKGTSSAKSKARGRALTIGNHTVIITTRREVSDETRAKIAAHFLGKKLSDEHRAKMSASHLGKKRPPSVGEKISAANRGRPRSAEHCENISEAKQKFIMTPLGMFFGITNARKAHGVSGPTFRKYVKQQPNHYVVLD